MTPTDSLSRAPEAATRDLYERLIQVELKRSLEIAYRQREMGQSERSDHRTCPRVSASVRWVFTPETATIQEK